jgi:hypothetical protein
MHFFKGGLDLPFNNAYNSVTQHLKVVILIKL